MNNIDLLFFKHNNYLKYPKILNLEITNHCPFQCPQCYKDPQGLKDMDVDFAMRIIDEAADMGVKRIMLNGGEPLIYPYFFEIVEYINKKGILPTCFTSGFGIDSIFTKKASNYNIEMLLSFNGSNKKIHNYSRDAFDVTYNAAEIFMNNNYAYEVNWVARHDNVHDFPQLIQKLINMKCHKITIVCNKVNGVDVVESELTSEDYEFLKYHILNNHDFVTIQNCNNILAQYAYDMPKSRLYGCPAGISSMCVTVDESFAPCPHLYYKEPNIGGMAYYWLHSRYLNQLRGTPTNKLNYCRQCSRNDKCNFCRAICTRSHNNLNDGYFNCPIFEEVEDEALKV